jgi:hypothetical protein
MNSAQVHLAMIDRKYIDSIRLIHSTLENSNIDWYIIGRTNLALQGINIVPEQIGVLIHSYDLDRFLSVFRKYSHSEITELPNGEAKEFILHIGSADALVCAEYEHGIFWKVFRKREKIFLEEMCLPCYSLESDRDAYHYLNMPERAKIIEDFLDNRR